MNGLIGLLIGSYIICWIPNTTFHLVRVFDLAPNVNCQDIEVTFEDIAKKCPFWLHGDISIIIVASTGDVIVAESSCESIFLLFLWKAVPSTYARDDSQSLQNVSTL